MNEKLAAYNLSITDLTPANHKQYRLVYGIKYNNLRLPANSTI